MATILSAIFRVLLYGTLAALIVIGAHYLLRDDGHESPASSCTQAQPDGISAAPATAVTAIQPVPPPSPATHDIVKAVDDDSSLSRSAKTSFEKGDYKTAVDLCKQLAERNKKASLCVGLSYFKLADYAGAIAYLEQSLEGGADEFTSRKYLSFAYYYRDNFDQSISNAEKGLGITKDPELGEFYNRLMKEKRTHHDYVNESSNHFVVRFDGYEHGEMSRKVIGMLEEAYSSIGRDLDYYPPEPITVILYTAHDFHDITQAPDWSGGIFDRKDGKIRVPVKGAERQEALLKTVLSHEYVHALIHSISKSCPLWVHEGMAEYYSKGPSQSVGQVIPLNRLENSLAGLNGKGIFIAYSESHSAVSYLMDKYRPYRIKELLNSLSRGNDLNTAFKDSFQMSYTEFIEKWGKK
jgi:tetratricopeptide (TPR) repeat protein